MRFMYIITEQLKPSDNPFAPLEGEDQKLFLASIEECGILEPLLVSKTGEGYYEILAGHNRYWAAVKLGIKELPCIVYEGDATDAIFDTNTCRRQFSREEKARFIKEKPDWRIKKMTQSVYPMLIPEIIGLYEEGTLSSQFVISIAHNYDTTMQENLVNALKKEIEVVRNMDEDTENLKRELEKTRQDGQKLRKQLQDRDTEIRDLRLKESRQKELLQEKMDEFENLKGKVGQEVRREFEADIEELRGNLAEMSHAVKAKQAEIDSLKENSRKVADIEKQYISEINAQKVLNKELANHYAMEIAKYSNPQLVNQKLDLINQSLKAAAQHLASFPPPSDAVAGMEKKLDCIEESASRVRKLLKEAPAQV